MDEIEPEQKLQEIDQTLPQEPTVVGAEARAGRLPRQLTAFRHRNYRLFFSGQIVSLTGTWMQQVAQGWLVLQLTNSALLLGIVAAISSLPVLVFSLPAGVVADRFRKRNMLLTTQTSLMTLAFIMAALIHSEVVTIYHIMAIGFLIGATNAFDAPARQAFVIEMVGREDLMNAIAMNSATFNSARIIGPAVAGVVIAALGIAGAYFLNGISFLAVILGLSLMRIHRPPPADHPPVLQGLKEGLSFIRGHARVSALLILTAVVSIFAISYAVLMPIFARDILDVGAKGLGYLMSSAGAGALCGALMLSTLGNFKGKGRLLLIGNLTFCMMLILFSTSRIMPLSMGLLMIAGWGMMTNMALTNTLIQTSVPDQLRGRVMSAYTLMFMGMAPLGSLQAGVLAHWLGAPCAVRIGASICALAAVILSPRILRSETME